MSLEAPLRVAVLSDLHIGSPPVVGAFGHDVGAFARHLDGLLATHDHVVLNGDVFQCDHGLRWDRDAHRGALARAMAAHPWLCERLDRPRVHYLRGNHDDVAHDVLGASERLVLGVPGAQVVITHGDQHDPVIGRAPGISAAATWFSGRVRRAGLGRLASALEDRDVVIKAGRFGGATGPYAAGAAALMVETGAQVAILGHTHIPEHHALPQGIFANPGSASLGQFRWVSVDLAAGDVRLMDAPAA